MTTSPYDAGYVPVSVARGAIGAVFDGLRADVTRLQADLIRVTAERDAFSQRWLKLSIWAVLEAPDEVGVIVRRKMRELQAEMEQEDVAELRACAECARLKAELEDTHTRIDNLAHQATHVTCRMERDALAKQLAAIARASVQISRGVAEQAPTYDAEWCQHDPRCQTRDWHAVLVQRESACPDQQKASHVEARA